MPQLVTVRVSRPDRRPVRIWVPVLPVLLVLFTGRGPGRAGGDRGLPRCYRISVVRALGAGWRVVSALPGTRVDIEQGRTAVLVAIR